MKIKLENIIYYNDFDIIDKTTTTEDQKPFQIG